MEPGDLCVILFMAAVFVLPLVLIRKLLRGFSRKGEPESPSDERFARWLQSEEREVKRTSDPRTKYCMENIGRSIRITYHGKRRTIKPLRVFRKPEYRKTYVEAEEAGEVKTFNIGEMKIG